MKKAFLFSLLFFSIGMVLLAGCTKEEEVVSKPIVEGTSLFSGDFTNASHPTSGKISVVKTKDNTIQLQFKDFKTDAGPDLFIYLAEDIGAKSAINTNQRPTNGTYAVTVDANTDFKKYKHVLIWCKSFSVLFGSAQLK
jgi:hypothetical protein